MDDARFKSQFTSRSQLAVGVEIHCGGEAVRLYDAGWMQVISPILGAFSAIVIILVP